MMLKNKRKNAIRRIKEKKINHMNGFKILTI